MIVATAELFFSVRVFSTNDPALDASASRAPGARRLDLRSGPSHGLPSGRVVPAGAMGTRLECESGGAGHARIRQPPPALRWFGGRPTSSDVLACHDVPTRDGRVQRRMTA